MEMMNSEMWESRAQAALDGKAKPPGSLGLLEVWAKKLAILQKTLTPQIAAARLTVFAADHGITLSTPAVSAFPRQVSAAVFKGIAAGGAASAVLCSSNGCSLNLVDVGLDADVSDVHSHGNSAQHVSVTHAKIRGGSHDMLKGAAMTGEEVADAEALGRDAVDRAVTEHGVEPSTLVICIGELGIGNTTAAAALVAALSGSPPEEVCGRGTGLDQDGVQRKIDAVTKALSVNAELISSGPRGALQAVGGLEIASMVGAYLHASKIGIPVIIDGFISGAAALVALRIDPSLKRCVFWSHRSHERGARVLFQAAVGVEDGLLGEEPESPALDMQLRLGEGTGAVLVVPLLRSAAAMMSNMVALKDL